MNPSASFVKDVFELLSYVAVVVGVIWGFVEYRRSVQREQQERHRQRQEQADDRRRREYETYDALDEKYLEYLRLCLDHPDLDIFDIPDAPRHPPSPAQLKQELIAFSLLFAVFERAFLMYRDHTDEVRSRQWIGWDAYIREFAARDNFSRAWEASGSTYDVSFESYMNSVLRGTSIPKTG